MNFKFNNHKLKFLATVTMGQSPDSDSVSDRPLGVPFLQGNAEFGIQFPKATHFCTAPKKTSNHGAILISVRAPVGALNWSEQSYCIGRGLCSVLASDSTSSKFLWWALHNAKGYLTSISTGSTFEAISGEQVSNLPILIPDHLNYQQKIAQFLDYETAKIDALIDEQKRLIELLKEKRQAVISHAVTKGLNPDVPVKDSGVEWLGDVPEHWSVVYSKYQFDFVTSGSRGWAEYYSDEGSLFFRIANLTRDTIEPKLDSVQKVIPPKGSEGERSRIKSNDILFSITADLGSVCVADKSVAEGYVSQHVALARPSARVNSARWLAYALISDPSKAQILGSGYGGTKVQLSLNDVKEVVLAEPSKVEQVEIADYLDSSLANMNNLLEEAGSLITLLRERRSALISAAVTGKIDVRDWQPPEGADLIDSNAAVQMERQDG